MTTNSQRIVDLTAQRDNARFEYIRIVKVRAPQKERIAAYIRLAQTAWALVEARHG